jgi:hypothetical protein
MEKLYNQMVYCLGESWLFFQVKLTALSLSLDYSLVVGRGENIVSFLISVIIFLFVYKAYKALSVA